MVVYIFVYILLTIILNFICFSNQKNSLNLTTTDCKQTKNNRKVNKPTVNKPLLFQIPKPFVLTCRVQLPQSESFLQNRNKKYQLSQELSVICKNRHSKKVTLQKVDACSNVILSSKHNTTSANTT